MRISDWSSDVCSSDLRCLRFVHAATIHTSTRLGRCGNFSDLEGTSMEILDPVAASTGPREGLFLHDGMDAALASLPFAPDEIVMHPKHGMGRIDGTEEREVAGHREQYLIVDFARLALTVGIPESAIARSGLRRPYPAEGLRAALAVLPDAPAATQGNWYRRAHEPEVKLNSGPPEPPAYTLRHPAATRGHRRSRVTLPQAPAPPP